LIIDGGIDTGMIDSIIITNIIIIDISSGCCSRRAMRLTSLQVPAVTIH